MTSRERSFAQAYHETGVSLGIAGYRHVLAIRYLWSKKMEEKFTAVNTRTWFWGLNTSNATALVAMFVLCAATKERNAVIATPLFQEAIAEKVSKELCIVPF
jgi:hypothetical protein